MSLIFVWRISQGRASIGHADVQPVTSEDAYYLRTFLHFTDLKPEATAGLFPLQQFHLNICRRPRTFRRLKLLSFKSSQRVRRHCVKFVQMQGQGLGLTAGTIMHWEAVGPRLSCTACKRSAPQRQERELVVRIQTRKIHEKRFLNTHTIQRYWYLMNVKKPYTAHHREWSHMTSSAPQIAKPLEMYDGFFRSMYELIVLHTVVQ